MKKHFDKPQVKLVSLDSHQLLMASDGAVDNPTPAIPIQNGNGAAAGAKASNILEF